MRKVLSLLCVFVLCLGMLSGCAMSDSYPTVMLEMMAVDSGYFYGEYTIQSQKEEISDETYAATGYTVYEDYVEYVIPYGGILTESGFELTIDTSIILFDKNTNSLYYSDDEGISYIKFASEEMDTVMGSYGVALEETSEVSDINVVDTVLEDNVFDVYDNGCNVTLTIGDIVELMESVSELEDLGITEFTDYYVDGEFSEDLFEDVEGYSDIFDISFEELNGIYRFSCDFVNEAEQLDGLYGMSFTYHILPDEGAYITIPTEFTTFSSLFEFDSTLPY